MQLNVSPNCPLDGFKPCRQMQCGWFIKLQGKDPQTGRDLDEWGCAVAWLPLLLVENAQEVRQGAAATESFRNEVARSAALLATLAALPAPPAQARPED